jgi:hypothetical protein
VAGSVQGMVDAVQGGVLRCSDAVPRTRVRSVWLGVYRSATARSPLWPTWASPVGGRLGSPVHEFERGSPGESASYSGYGVPAGLVCWC